MLTIEDIINKTKDLPSLPAATLKVIRDTESSTATASSIANTLSQDQSLCVRVLRLANSPYYGLARQVNDLQEAVVVLGMRTVRNIAIVASTYPWMIRPLNGYALGPKALWTHAFSTAVGAQIVATKSKAKCEDTAFTSGLLHDVGKVVLSLWLENKLGALVALAQRDNISFAEAERKVFGFDHTEIGEALGNNWNLPESLVRAIRYHHSPSECNPTNPVVDCVHIGDYLTMSMGFGLGGDGLLYEIDENAWKRLGLDGTALPEIIDEFVMANQKYEAMFEELQAA